MLKNFHGSLTTVVRAQNDTCKTANITDNIFDRTYCAVLNAAGKLHPANDRLAMCYMIRAKLVAHECSRTRPKHYVFGLALAESPL